MDTTAFHTHVSLATLVAFVWQLLTRSIIQIVLRQSCCIDAHSYFVAGRRRLTCIVRTDSMRSVNLRVLALYCIDRERRAENIHCVPKKEAAKLLAVTFSNLSRFSKFFHCWKGDEISNKTAQYFPPHLVDRIFGGRMHKYENGLVI